MIRLELKSQNEENASLYIPSFPSYKMSIGSFSSKGLTFNLQSLTLQELILLLNTLKIDLIKIVLAPNKHSFKVIGTVGIHRTYSDTGDRPRCTLGSPRVESQKNPRNFSEEVYIRSF